MKKFLVIFISMISMMIMVPSVSYAQFDKATTKEIKKKLKEFNKEGWKIFGSTRTLEGALNDHFKKRSEGGYEVFGTASVTDSKHKNVLHQAALANACATYAGDSRKVIGQTISQMALATEEKDEFEHFAATYQTKVEKDIKGELRESFAMIKEVSKDQIDMQIYCIAKGNAAVKVFEDAMKESEIAKKYKDEIIKSLKEAFDSK